MLIRLSPRSAWSTLFMSTIVGIVFGVLTLNIGGLEPKWLLAIILGLMVIAATVFSGQVRLVSLLLLIVSLAVNVNYHITYWPEHLGVPDGLTIELTDIFILALILLSASKPGSQREIQLFPCLTIPAIIILLTDVFSLRNSADATLTFYGLVDHARAFVLFFLIANQIRSYKDLKTIFIGLQVYGVLIGGLCILEAALEVNLSANLREQNLDEESIFRAAGLLTPTYTGGLLASLVPLIVVQLWLFKSRIAAFITLSVLCTTLLGLFFTLTRGAWVSLGVSLFFMLLVLALKRQLKIKHIIPGLILTLVLISLLGTFFYVRIFERIDEGLNNVVARVGLFSTAWEMIKDNPLTGIGLNNYTLRMDEYEPDHLIHSFRYIIHNRYILFWAETGIMGMMAFIWFLKAALLICLRCVNRLENSDISIAALGLFGAIITTALHMNLEAYEGGGPFLYVWLLIGLSAALSVLEQRQEAMSGVKFNQPQRNAKKYG